ncbi:Fasciclin domain-containing protein [Lyophyllum atratum]|nr:Fasciclin domain-containing protein [Lyophyllum atratum]
MRNFLLSLVLSGICLHAQAQSLDAPGLMSAFQKAGLTSFATALGKVNGTKPGQDMMAALVNGNNYTVYAPNNAAFDAPAVASVSNNPQLLAQVLSYHVVPGYFVNSTQGNASLACAVLPSVTVAHTLLTDGTLVDLEGNNAQVVAWTRNDMTSNSTIYFLNQKPEVTVLTTMAVGHILVATISNVLMPPGSFDKVAAANNLTSLNGIVDMVAVPSFFPNGTNATVEQALEANRTQGYTFFAPDDAALKNAQSTLTGLVNNQTALLALLSNHYINGTTYYSPQLDSSSSNFVSAAGQSLTFNANSSGTYITSANGASAKIIKTDVLTDRGVIHIVDHVLVNLNRDDAKAMSAYQSATSAAAQRPTQTGPIGASSTSSSGGSTGGGGHGTKNTAIAMGVASAGGAVAVGALGWILFMGLVVG